jgi:hypothetical protein
MEELLETSRNARKRFGKRFPHSRLDADRGIGQQVNRTTVYDMISGKALKTIYLNHGIIDVCGDYLIGLSSWRFGEANMAIFNRSTFLKMLNLDSQGHPLHKAK